MQLECNTVVITDAVGELCNVFTNLDQRDEEEEPVCPNVYFSASKDVMMNGGLLGKLLFLLC